MSFFTAQYDSEDKKIELDFQGIARLSANKKPDKTGPIPGVFVIIVNSPETEKVFRNYSIPFVSINEDNVKKSLIDLKDKVFESDQPDTLLVVKETLIFSKYPDGLSDYLKRQSKKNMVVYSSKPDSGCDICSQHEKRVSLSPGSVGSIMIGTTAFLKSTISMVVKNLNRDEFKDSSGEISYQNVFRLILSMNHTNVGADVKGELFERYGADTDISKDYGVNVKQATKKETESLAKDAKEAAKVVTMSQIRKLQGHSLSTKEVQDRIIACKGGGPENLPPCPKYLANRGKQWCALCRCNMETKVKFLAAPCKIGRWAK